MSMDTDRFSPMTPHFLQRPPTAARRHDDDDARPVGAADAVEIRADRIGDKADNGRSYDTRKASADRLLPGVALDTAPARSATHSGKPRRRRRPLPTGPGSSQGGASDTDGGDGS